MAIYFQPNLCCVADIPKEYESFYESPSFFKLKLNGNKIGLNVSFLCLDGFMSVMTIGRPLNTSFGYFENQLIRLKEFKEYERREEEIADVSRNIRSFLNSLNGDLSWIAYLNWSDVEVMFYTHG